MQMGIAILTQGSAKGGGQAPEFEEGVKIVMLAS